MVITLTPVILSVRIKEEKATKVGMPPAPLNPSKALISKSGPPHDHFNWYAMEICAEWLGLARGLFHITFSERHHTKRKKEKKKTKSIQYCALWSWESVLESWDILWVYLYSTDFYFQHPWCSIISSNSREFDTITFFSPWELILNDIIMFFNHVVLEINLFVVLFYSNALWRIYERIVRTKNVSIEPVCRSRAVVFSSLLTFLTNVNNFPTYLLSDIVV